MATWLNKGALIVPSTVILAKETPDSWLDSLSLIKDCKMKESPLPTVKSLLEYKEKTLGEITKNSAQQLCETAYSINRAYNAKPESYPKAKARLSRTKPTKMDSLTSDSLSVCSSFFLNTEDIKQRNYSVHLGDINANMKDLVEYNTDWRLGLLEQLKQQLEIAEGKIKSAIKRAIKVLEKSFGIDTSNKFAPPPSQFKTFTGPVATPITELVSGVNSMSTALLSDLIFKSATVPPAFMPVASNAVTSIVLKNLGASGAELARQEAGVLFRSVPGMLPQVFNNTGMFAGAWSGLMAAAPYLIIAGVIITAAIEMTRDCEVGNEYICVAYEGFKLRAYSFTIVGLEKKEERLKYFQTIKDAIINGQEGKVLRFTNLYIFTREKGNVKLSVDFTGPMIPWSKEQTAVNWVSLCTQCRWLVDDNVPPFPIFEP